MFPTTRQTIFERYHRGGDERQRAVADWFTRYRSPMCDFVARYDSRRREEIVDAFILSKLLPKKEEQSILARYAPQPGRRFRHYLKASLRNFCISGFRAEGRRSPTVALDENLDSPSPDETDEFDILWARQVVGRAIRRVKKLCESDRRLFGVWVVLKDRFLRPFRGKPPIDYAEIVRQFGYKTPSHAQKDASKAKKLLREALISVVSEYEGAEAAPFELMDLWRVIRRIRENKPR